MFEFERSDLKIIELLAMVCPHLTLISIHKKQKKHGKEILLFN